MNFTYTCWILIGLLGIWGFLAPNHTVEREVKTAPGQLLIVNLASGGDLRIHGEPGNIVRVRVRLSDYIWRKIHLTLDPVSGGVRLNSDTAPGTPVASVFDITVPRQYSVQLKSAGGRLLICDLDGEFRGSIAGGMITLNHVRGRADLSTSGGAIHVVDSDLGGSIKTGGGSITLKRVSGSLHVAYN